MCKCRKKAYANNEYQTALEYYYKALKIVMKIHGEKHIEAAILFKNIANCYYQMGFYANALNFFMLPAIFDLFIYNKIMIA
ncbi:MAG: tetratricopeptide repeat protein [Coxiellaceae bacterium]|nr:MAG: tetratricopeptide repeat protein [Coxiellaceae bacterium]